MRVLTLSLILLFSNPAQAVEQVWVLALFPGKAMLQIDGKRRVMVVGETSPEGVTLVAADPRQATISQDGERRTLELSARVSNVFRKPPAAEVILHRTPAGGYHISGLINGRTVQFLLDTGADVVAMGAADARRIGIPYRLRGKPVAVATAGGPAEGYMVKLDRVRVGDIELRDVDGVVIDDQMPDRVLLGMSFLNRVTMESRGSVLVLRSAP